MAMSSLLFAAEYEFCQIASCITKGLLQWRQLAERLATALRLFADPVTFLAHRWAPSLVASQRSPAATGSSCANRACDASKIMLKSCSRDFVCVENFVREKQLRTQCYSDEMSGREHQHARNYRSQ
jgi:hypothetical protein